MSGAGAGDLGAGERGSGGAGEADAGTGGRGDAGRSPLSQGERAGGEGRNGGGGAAGAPLARAVLAQARVEFLLLLRRGESLLINLFIPAGLLVFFSGLGMVDTGGQRPVDFLLPGMLALAVMASGMVSLGIATAFERQDGVLKQIGSTPLPRGGLVLAKTLALLGVDVLQVLLLVGLAAGLYGWRPDGAVGLAAVALLLGSLAFAGLGMAMAGSLRAEATLAAANGLFLVFLLLGGMLMPLESLPAWLAAVASALPAAALAETLRAALTPGAPMPVPSLLVLLAWAIATPLLAARVFRWE